MLKHGYLNAGLELGFLYVSLLDEISEELNEDTLQAIDTILASFPVLNMAEQSSFLVRCIDWSEKCGKRKYGDVGLRQRLGICTWSLGEEKRAIYHFAVAEAPLVLWNLISMRYAAESNSSWVEETATLSILHFLALDNLRDANILFGALKQSLPPSRRISFLSKLLRTCERDAAPLFKVLCERYNAETEFDPTCEALLEGPIAKKFFGISNSSPSLLSFISDFLGGGGSS